MFPNTFVRSVRIVRTPFLAFTFSPFFLMTSPNFGSGGGSCLPSMVVAALGGAGCPGDLHSHHRLFDRLRLHFSGFTSPALAGGTDAQPPRSMAPPADAHAVAWENFFSRCYITSSFQYYLIWPLYQLDLSRSLVLSEEQFERAVKPKPDNPASARDGLGPIAVLHSARLTTLLFSCTRLKLLKRK